MSKLVKLNLQSYLNSQELAEFSESYKTAVANAIAGQCRTASKSVIIVNGYSQYGLSLTYTPHTDSPVIKLQNLGAPNHPLISELTFGSKRMIYILDIYNGYELLDNDIECWDYPNYFLACASESLYEAGFKHPAKTISAGAIANTDGFALVRYENIDPREQYICDTYRDYRSYLFAADYSKMQNYKSMTNTSAVVSFADLI